MHTAGKIFVKTSLKAIRDKPFFPMWNFPMCDSNPTEGESLNF